MTMSKTVRPGSLTPTQCTFGASVTVGMGYSSLVPGFRSVCRLELVLPRAAEGAHPVVRDVLEGGARRHAVVRVAGGRVVDVVADDASPFLHRTPRCGKRFRNYIAARAQTARRPGRPLPAFRSRALSSSSRAGAPIVPRGTDRAEGRRRGGRPRRGRRGRASSEGPRPTARRRVSTGSTAGTRAPIRRRTRPRGTRTPRPPGRAPAGGGDRPGGAAPPPIRAASDLPSREEVRYVRTTVYPAFARAREIAAPILRLPPVTSATFPRASGIKPGRTSRGAPRRWGRLQEARRPGGCSRRPCTSTFSSGVSRGMMRILYHSGGDP